MGIASPAATSLSALRQSLAGPEGAVGSALRRYLLRLALLAAGYFAAGQASALIARGDVVSSLWPPAGVALFALLRFGPGLWPGVALGSLLASLSWNVPLPVALVLALAESIAALLMAFVLVRIVEFRPELDRPASVVALLAAAAAGSAIAATAAVSADVAAGLAPATASGTLWQLWWSGDTIGVLVISPLLLAWTTQPDLVESTRSRSFGGLLLLAGLVAGLVLFLRGTPAYLYVAVLLVTTIAFHFGRRAATTAVAIAALLAIWETARGVGPFVPANQPPDLLLLQLFLALLSLASLLITAGLAERREVASRLEEETARFSAAQEMGRFGTWQWDPGQDRMSLSPELMQLLGLGSNHFAGRLDDFLSLAHPEDREPLRAAMKRAVLEGGGFGLNQRIDGPGGRPRILTTTGECVGREPDRPVAIVGISRDVTEQWHAEAAPREHEELLRAVFDRSPMGVVLCDLDGRFIRANDAYVRMMGYSAEELTRMTVRDLTDPEDSARVHPVLDQLLDGERKSFDVEKRNRRKDGSLVWVRVWGSLIPDESGAPRYLLGIVKDIDERKRTEAELRRVQEAYREIVEWAPLGVFRSTHDGRVLLANRAVGDMLGYRSPAEVRRLDLRRDVSADPAEWDSLMARLDADGRPHRAELRWRKRDGAPIWVELRSHVVRDLSGRTLYFENFVHDITERHRAEMVLADEKEILELLARGAGLDEVLDRLCRLVESWMPGMLCSVLLLEEGARLRHGAGPSLPRSFVSALDGAPIGPPVASGGAAAYPGEPVVVEDIEQSPLWTDFRALARGAGLRACWSMPIHASDGIVIGTFAMYYREPWRPSVREWQLVERASHLAGLAIERSRRMAELQRRTTEKQETERRYRMLASHLPDAGVALFDRDLRVVLAEGPALSAAVRSKTGAEGRKVFEITPKASANRVAAEAGSVFLGSSTDFEVEDRRQAYLVRLLPIRDEQGSVALGMLLLIDITERRRHERVRRQLLGRLTDAQEQERRRIAREVHDEAGQSLTALLVGLRMLRAAETVDGARDEAARLQAVAAETLENLGRLARGLHPSVLDDMGLPPAVTRYAREYTSHYQIPVAVEVEGFDGHRLAPELEAALYRIVLEALTNTARHSHATHASIRLRHAAGWVEATVRDDGRGFDVAAALRGDGEAQTLGLHGIRERAEFLGGTARVTSGHGRGTVVTVRVPASA